MADLRSLIAGDDQQGSNTAMPASRPSTPPSNMKWGGTKLSPELLQQFQLEAEQGKREVAPMLQSYYQANFPTPRQQGFEPGGSYAPTVQTTGQPTDQLRSLVSGEQPAAPLEQDLGFVGNAFKRAFQLKQRAAGETAAAIDFVANAPSAVVGNVGYWTGRAFGLNDKEAQEASQKVAGAIANPVGRLTGTVETPGYQGSLLTQGLQKVGEGFTQAAQYGSEKTGISPTDIEQGVNTALMLVPGVYKGGKTIIKKANAALPGVKGSGLANMQQQFATKGGRVEPTMETGAPTTTPSSVGAAGVAPADVLASNIDASLATASPELNQFIKSKDPNAVNLPALQTKALEEKHKVNLTTSQRIGDTQGYASEWNKRGETPELQTHFNEQPAQIAGAFDNLKQQHAPDINPLADASELGQHEINGLSAKDAIRKDAISKAYKELTDANGGQFPIDVGTVKENIANELSKNYKENYLSSDLKSDLERFYKNPTFEGYEAVRSNLADEMRSATDGKSRQAAWIARNELEKLPIFGEENAAFDPQAAHLKSLADKARNLYKERQDIIRSNPAYKAAIKEAASLEDVSSQGESLDAAKFHKKYVSSATPEAIRRMKAEIDPNDIAHQAITFGELDRAKNAAISAKNDLQPASFAKFLRDNKSSLNEALHPEAMQGVSEIGLLASKIGMPKTGTFNYSNTYSSMLSDLAKQGLTSAGEAKLAGATSGMSIPVVSMIRQFAEKHNKDAFAKQATHPFGGLTKD
jgi:hypothetical protein